MLRAPALLAWTISAALPLIGMGASIEASFRPRDPHHVLAVFPPWWTADASLLAAVDAGAVAGFGRASFLVAVVSEEPGLAGRLFAAGALAVVDGRALVTCVQPVNDGGRRDRRS